MQLEELYEKAVEANPMVVKVEEDRQFGAGSFNQYWAFTKSDVFHAATPDALFINLRKSTQEAA